MKTVLVCVGIAALILGGYFIGNKLFPPEPPYLASHSGKLESAGKWILAKQIQTYSDLQEKRAWLVSDAIVYYKWQSINEWGIDFGSAEYDLHLKESNGIVAVTVPDLQYFGPKIPLERGKFIAQVVNKGWFINEHQLIYDYYDVINTLVNNDGMKMLKDSDLLKLCRDTIGLKLLDLFNQARDTRKYVGINIKFSNEESGGIVNAQALLPVAEHKMSFDETLKANFTDNGLKDFSQTIKIQGKEMKMIKVQKK
jgi:hypothetical protein